MIKKLTILLALVGGFAIADTPDATRGRIAASPLRRVLAPPYPVARRAAIGPRYYARPYYTGYRGGFGYGGYGGYGPGYGGGIYIGF